MRQLGIRTREPSDLVSAALAIWSYRRISALSTTGRSTHNRRHHGEEAPEHAPFGLSDASYSRRARVRALVVAHLGLLPSLLPMLGGAVRTGRLLFSNLDALAAAIREGIQKTVLPLHQMRGRTMGMLDFLFSCGDDQDSLRTGRGVLPAEIASKGHALLLR
jgi:hypothetical protein